MNRTRTIPALFTGLALVLAACGTAPADEPSEAGSGSSAPSATAAPSEAAAPSAAGGGEETVRLEGFAFDADELAIAAGTSVRFVNADGAAHTVTEGSDGAATDDPILDEELAPNGVTSFVFDEPGTYLITCLFHPSMNMTVVVE
ncbi:MAG: plastocyanin/azurin family copper-binding protein [Candidatus Limnocylindria bacterium]